MRGQRDSKSNSCTEGTKVNAVGISGKVLINEQNTNPILSQVRVLPNLDPKPRNRGGRPRKHPLPDPNAPKRGPGRPKGSKNKSTLEREALLANHAELTEKKHKGTPGRPKGSKNKATLEREAREEAERVASKRGPGRPKGSRNQKTLEREAKEAELARLAKSKGRGRPKESKNKPKPLPSSSEERETMQVASPEQINLVAPPMPQISVDNGGRDVGSTAPVQENYSAGGDGKSDVS